MRNQSMNRLGRIAAAIVGLGAITFVVSSAVGDNSMLDPSSYDKILRSPSKFAGIKNRNRRSIALFTEAGKVLTHPRCVNCHPDGDEPGQGERGVPHQPWVQRGEDGQGVIGVALQHVPSGCQLRSRAGSRRSQLASGTAQHGLAGQIAQTDLRADQGSQSQRQQDDRANRRAHGSRQIGRLGLVTGCRPRAGPGQVANLCRADQGLGR